MKSKSLTWFCNFTIVVVVSTVVGLAPGRSCLGRGPGRLAGIEIAALQVLNQLCEHPYIGVTDTGGFSPSELAAKLSIPAFVTRRLQIASKACSYID